MIAILGLVIRCEDTKKRTTEIKKNTFKKEEVLNSSKKKEVPKPKIKLTHKNAVSFLTEFGKKNTENNIRIITTYGNIDIELYNDTPIHRANIIYLGFFDILLLQKLSRTDELYHFLFHRVICNYFQYPLSF